jgi:GNAT superfamily N-acetyltransferase
MRPVLCRASEDDARAVHDIIAAIPWISETAKSENGFTKTKECCGRGEVVVVKVNAKITSMMILREGKFAESKRSNVYIIPLVATLQSERRKGHARRLVRKAKQIVRRGAIQAHAENDRSLSLLLSEGFVRVEGEVDRSGHPLYEWMGNWASVE